MVRRGSTYDHNVDGPRLRSQFQRVVALMLDGLWHTAEDVRRVGGAEGLKRLRELRHSVFGGAKVEAQPVDQRRGVWQYRLDLDTIDDDMVHRIMVEGLRPPMHRHEAGLVTCPHCGHQFEPVPVQANPQDDLGILSVLAEPDPAGG